MSYMTQTCEAVTHELRKNGGNDTCKLDQVDTASTARIDRRQTVLAQIEAALLADKLSVVEMAEEGTGTDPYNRGVPRATSGTPSGRADQSGQ